MKNRYYIVRHGRSEANQKKIIVSDPAIGTMAYSLTEEGRQEVQSAISEMIERGVFDGSTRIISSDFQRTRETAEIIRAMLEVETVHFEPRLRERYFGLLDGLSNSNYDAVWEADLVNPEHKNDDVESVYEVAMRVMELIDELEERHSNENIVLVSHGDTLQILQAICTGHSPSQHRNINHIETGEIRKLMS